MPRAALWYRWVLAVCERSYRAFHRLDAGAAQVGPALSVEIRRGRRRLQLADGVLVDRGEPIGVIHLSNRRVAALHGERPGAVGLVFRRRFVASLRALAARAADGGSFAPVRAFSATTIFTGLERLGFAEASGDRVARAGFVAAYQRALLSTLHPAGARRLRRLTSRRARRFWISRERLLALYAPAASSREAPAPVAEDWTGSPIRREAWGRAGREASRPSG